LLSIDSKGLSEEDVVEVEYFLISDAPKEDQDKPHRDWVSAVSGSGQGHMASGCYDKIARMFPPGAKEEDAVELHGHTEAVTSVSLSDDGAKLASGSLDHTVRAWCIGGGHARLEGHSAGVSCVEVYKERIISGSADKTLKLWALPTHDEVAGSGGESKKVSKGAKAAKVSEGEGDVKVRGCLSTLIAHTAPVTGAGWGEEGRVWSGSWDHSVRGWDVETQSDTAVMSGGHAVTSVAVMNVGAQRGALVASGHTDRIVRVWDPRSGGAAMVSAALSSHKGWVSAG
jgi:ribosome biogenesis protein YTM1